MNISLRPSRAAGPAWRHHAPRPTPSAHGFQRGSPRSNAAAGDASSSENPVKVFEVPPSPEQQVLQAAAACEAAWRSGVTRQRVDLLLPLIGATDLDDWPGGIRQQFKAAQPLVEGILRRLKLVDGLTGPLDASMWDDGDAVAAYMGKNLSAVVFPTAETLDKLRAAADAGPKLLVVFNPQWSLTGGNLINPFGWGARKQANEALVGSFQSSYFLKQMRIYGDDIRVLHSHPGAWQVHLAVDPRKAAAAAAAAAAGGGGRSPPRGSGGGAASLLPVIATLAQEPTYAELEKILKARPDSNSSKDWVERLKSEMEFNQQSLKQ